MGNLGWPQIVIILAVVVLLFGSRKLPELARGLGSSLRIFRSETKGMMDADKGESAETSANEQPRAVEAPQATPAEPVHNPVSEGITDPVKRDN
jgi:sec-independent protein translocase protein TatA